MHICLVSINLGRDLEIWLDTGAMLNTCKLYH